MAESKRPPPEDSSLPAPEGLTATRFEVGGQPLLLLSFPVEPAPAPELTAAERDVARLLVKGASNHAIAAARGTSVRTVANQVASLLRKCSAGSRYELIALLARVELDG